MNEIDQDLLPLGSIFYLKDGNQKLMVVSRGVIYTDDTSGEDTFMDYLCCKYPYGYLQLNDSARINADIQTMQKITIYQSH
ncbi:DUF4176 domain-containing protein [Companilactobacillus mishanensis]|uniref:DUF4176 domain-containing protein n=1 Tax=Companilactobacillus mishanensis TaxID=2486008 RepID=A0A5P0ZKB3_9LACO|nr:DUF4176 domain-containing protein [Companilactobacillus mishanensis]MQS53551.1 DUF4176 domain-containing protein [Companilactobacillus mishanensis]